MNYLDQFDDSVLEAELARRKAIRSLHTEARKLLNVLADGDAKLTFTVMAQAHYTDEFGSTSLGVPWEVPAELYSALALRDDILRGASEAEVAFEELAGSMLSVRAVQVPTTTLTFRDSSTTVIATTDA